VIRMMPRHGSFRRAATLRDMRRTLGTPARRRLSLFLVPLAVLFTATAVGRGDWVLAALGVIVFVSQVAVVISSRPTLRRAPEPERPPTVAQTPTPRSTRADRVAARRPGGRRR
jgi:hypothetical protein